MDPEESAEIEEAPLGPPAEPKEKTTYRFGPKLSRAVRELAKKMDWSEADVLEKAVGLLHFAVEQKQRGSTLEIHQSNGQRFEVQV